MKSRMSFTLDQEVGQGMDKYFADLVKGLPASLQGGARIRSQAVNNILKEFLQKKGYLTVYTVEHGQLSGTQDQIPDSP